MSPPPSPCHPGTKCRPARQATTGHHSPTAPFSPPQSSSSVHDRWRNMLLCACWRRRTCCRAATTLALWNAQHTCRCVEGACPRARCTTPSQALHPELLLMLPLLLLLPRRRLDAEVAEKKELLLYVVALEHITGARPTFIAPDSRKVHQLTRCLWVCMCLGFVSVFGGHARCVAPPRNVPLALAVGAPSALSSQRACCIVESGRRTLPGVVLQSGPCCVARDSCLVSAGLAVPSDQNTLGAPSHPPPPTPPAP